MDGEVSEDEEIDVDKEIYATGSQSTSINEIYVSSFVGLSLRDDPDSS
jgi:hypothetical protein